MLEEIEKTTEDESNDEEGYFCYRASLRIFLNDIMDLDAITKYLGCFWQVNNVALRKFKYVAP